MKIFFPFISDISIIDPYFMVLGLFSRKTDDDDRDIIRNKKNLILIITTIPSFNLTLFDNYLFNLFDTALQYFPGAQDPPTKDLRRM